MNLPPPRAQTSVAVFARAPVPGAAKTRLIPRLGRDGAAHFQRLLIERAVRTARDARVGDVSLWCAPDCAHPAFDATATAFDVPLRRQTGADLGARMHAAFDALCARGAAALLIGTDSPALSPDALRAAARALDDGNDAVFGPADDGGYVLVGLRRPVAALFRDMPWSTDRLMDATRGRLREAGIAWGEIAPSWDVDRPDDFERLLASGCMPEAASLAR